MRTLSNFATLGSEAAKKIWTEEEGLLIYDQANLAGRSSDIAIAAYDLDNTIISTNSGRIFAKNADDWKFLFPEVPKILRRFSDENYLIVIFTNQLGVGLDLSRKKQKEFKLKIENIQRKLGIPLTLYAATREDNYRKPCIGMWKDLLLRLDQAAINLEQSFFIGDAAGRPPGWKPGKKADHSDVDRKFGQNLGIQFFTPEQHFLGADPEPFVTSSFQPRLVFADLANDDSSFLVPRALNSPEILIFIGYPASGKTFFYSRHLASSHQRLSPELCGSLAKCLAEVEKCLMAGVSVVIDDTNPSKAVRSRYIAIGALTKSRIRCLNFAVDLEVALHLDKYRSITTSVLLTPERSFLSHRNRYQPPEAAEGIDEVIQLPFVPVFETEETKNLLQMYLQ